MTFSWLNWKCQNFVFNRYILMRTLYSRGHSKKQVDTLTKDNQYDRLAAVITPLYLRPYSRQLEMKDYLMRKVLKKIHNIITCNRNISTEELKTSHLKYGDQICEFLGVKPSPIVDGYRNKACLDFGTDMNGNSKTIGYHIGKYKDNNIVYIEPFLLCNISDHHKNIFKTVGEFIRLSPHKAETSRKGVWRSATVRSTTMGEAMLCFLINPYTLSEAEFEEAKNSLINYYVSGPGKLVGVTSLFLLVSTAFNPRFENTENIHLSGTTYITEVLNGKKFKISPSSFFQINSSAAEVLFSTIGEMLKEKSVSNLLDVCCGTGTIGLILSDYVRQVYGIDVVPDAIECAKDNAEINGITNAVFTCSMAHRAMNQWISEDNDVLKLDNITAIINPSRIGLNKKFIYAVRNSPVIKQVIYVSCKPSGNALRNIVDLIVPESEELSGQPFQAEKAVAVDMFPHTRHCEFVISLVR